MKQGKLIRRAVSAALAGCMMFTLSAPALAESTVPQTGVPPRALRTEIKIQAYRPFFAEDLLSSGQINRSN